LSIESNAWVVTPRHGANIIESEDTQLITADNSERRLTNSHNRGSFGDMSKEDEEKIITALLKKKLKKTIKKALKRDMLSTPSLEASQE